MDEIKTNDEVNGRYVLKECKGRGTFGQVWRTYDRATDGDVAIKFYVALDHKGREEFIQEFRIAAQLRHPNLLLTMDYGEWRDHPYLTMKYCGNGSAGDLVGTLKPCWKDEHTIWRFIHDVAAGLAYLHSVEPDPIVHQDIKPDNILIDADGTFVISDFGISKRIRNTMRKQSTRALKAGAPAYMGPERFSENPEPILASDVWSLGASIYELAEGELPFSGMGGVMMNQGVEIPNLSPGWSDNLYYAMHWCLEKNTWDRAKASQISYIAQKVLDSDNTINVQELIIELKGNKKHSHQKDNRKKDPRATNPYANGNNAQQLNSDINNQERASEYKSEDEDPSKLKKAWYKRPLTLAIAAVVIILVIIVGIWIVPSADRNQTNPQLIAERTDTSDKLAQKGNDTIQQSTEKKKNNINAPKKTDVVNPKPITPAKPIQDNEIKEEKTSSGTLNLGYGTWNGSIKNGKPDGRGTLTFTSSHRIDSRDSQRRMADAGDRIEGTYEKGHLDYGTWHKSDGTTEPIMLGE